MPADDKDALLNNVIAWMDLVDIFIERGISSYVVELDRPEPEVKDKVIYIPPELEAIVADLIKEAMPPVE